LALECDIRAGAIAVDERQRTSMAHIWAAGECTGIGGAELACVEGRIAGLAASGVPIPPALVRTRERWRRFAARLDEAFALGEAAREQPANDTLLCRCEDVPIGAVAGYANWRDAKLHTRCGMGPCQGRICGAAAQVYFGWDSAPPRPPFTPARIGTLLQAAPADRARTL